jgi:hypothetical protein
MIRVRPLLLATALLLLARCQPPEIPSGAYPAHNGITTTVFWVGEAACAANRFSGNEQSAWDSKWLEHYGGVDDPDHRNGYFPAGFTPKENPFYCALPYGDFDEHGRRASAGRVIYWAGEKVWSDTESMCKNRWIGITRGSRTAYAQWEDVGPFETDDSAYVFGPSRPRNVGNDSAGLDVSPAVRDYLGLTGRDKVDWQFVPLIVVPDGPWTLIVTTRQICWQ